MVMRMSSRFCPDDVELLHRMIGAARLALQPLSCPSTSYVGAADVMCRVREHQEDLVEMLGRRMSASIASDVASCSGGVAHPTPLSTPVARRRGNGHSLARTRYVHVP